jgi:hypothetical protein
MAIKMLHFRLNRFAGQLRKDGVTSVNIRIDENDIPAGNGRSRRALEAVIVTDRRTFRMGPDLDTTPYTWGQIRAFVGGIPHRQKVAGMALAAAEVLERRGIGVTLIDGVPTEKVRAELEGRAGHGLERY